MNLLDPLLQREKYIEELRAENARLRDGLNDALYAWTLVRHMACSYAVAGGNHSPEMRGYDEATERIQHAQAALRPPQESAPAEAREGEK